MKSMQQTNLSVEEVAEQSQKMEAQQVENNEDSLQVMEKAGSWAVHGNWAWMKFGRKEGHLTAEMTDKQSGCGLKHNVLS